MALTSNRVFNKGLNSEGSIIGEYSKNEIYVSGKARVKPKTLKGKYGETKFKDGTPHKSGYFASYLDYKKDVGRNKIIQTVDLKLSGDLHRDFANGKIEKPEMRKANVHSYYIGLNEENIKKVKRYGNVFLPTTSEKKEFLETLRVELINALT